MKSLRTRYLHRWPLNSKISNKTLKVMHHLLRYFLWYSKYIIIWSLIIQSSCKLSLKLSAFNFPRYIFAEHFLLFDLAFSQPPQISGFWFCRFHFYLSSMKQSDPGHFFSMSPFLTFLRFKKSHGSLLLDTAILLILNS